MSQLVYTIVEYWTSDRGYINSERLSIYTTAEKAYANFKKLEPSTRFDGFFTVEVLEIE